MEEIQAEISDPAAAASYPPLMTYAQCTQLLQVNVRTPQFVVDAWMGHAGHAQMGRHYYGLTDEKSKQFMTRVQF